LLNHFLMDSKFVGYSKVEKYVDRCSVEKPSLPLARVVTSPIRDVQLIVGFTIIWMYYSAICEKLKS